MSSIENDPYGADLDPSRPSDAILHELQDNAGQLLTEQGFCSLEERTHAYLTEDASLLFKAGYPPDVSGGVSYRPMAKFQVLGLMPDNSSPPSTLFVSFSGTEVVGFGGMGDPERTVDAIEGALKDPRSGYASQQVLAFAEDLMGHLIRRDKEAVKLHMTKPERDGHTVADLVRMATSDETAEARRRHTYMARIGLAESLVIVESTRVDDEIDLRIDPQRWLMVSSQDHSKGRLSTYQVYATGQRAFREFKLSQNMALPQPGLVQSDRVTEKLVDTIAALRLGSSEIEK